MSLTASYSPSISYNDDLISERHDASELREEVSADFDEGQIFSPPFFYSQGNYTSYFDKKLDQQHKKEKILHRLSNDQAQTKKKLKRKRGCSLKSTSSISYIARRDRSGARGRYAIKINIYELGDHDQDSDDASVSVQYIVREPFDEVMDATQTLVRKISNKLE